MSTTLKRTRKIQILRGKNLTSPVRVLDDGEFGLERSLDGLSLKLFIGTPTGNKLVGMDFESDFFQQFIIENTLPPSVIEKINNALTWDKVGDGLVGTAPDTVSMGIPSAITQSSTNSLTKLSHTHLLAANAVTNAKLNVMPANTLKGAIVAGDPVDLSMVQVRTMLGISNIDDFNDASKLTRGYLSMDRIADHSITEIKLHPDLLAKLGSGGGTGIEEDPYVADWARKPNSKPTYTIDEIIGGLSIEEFNNFKNNINNYVTGTTPLWEDCTLSFIDGTGASTGIEIYMGNLITNIRDAGNGKLLVSTFDGGGSEITISSAGGTYTGGQTTNIEVTLTNNSIQAWLKDGTIDIGKLDDTLGSLINSISRKYEMPLTGIPLSDLSTAVQNRLVPATGTTGYYLRKTTTGTEWAQASSLNSASINLPTTGWGGSGTARTQSFTVTGMTSDMIVIVTAAPNATQAQYLDFQDIWPRVTSQGSNTITVTTLNTPLAAIPVTIVFGK